MEDFNSFISILVVTNYDGFVQPATLSQWSYGAQLSQKGSHSKRLLSFPSAVSINLVMWWGWQTDNNFLNSHMKTLDLFPVDYWIDNFISLRPWTTMHSVCNFLISALWKPDWSSAYPLILHEIPVSAL